MSVNKLYVLITLSCLVSAGCDSDDEGVIDVVTGVQQVGSELSACTPGGIRSCTQLFETSYCAGVQTCGEDGKWPTDEPSCIFPSESCDGSDNDCDGKVDEDYQAE